MTTYHHQNINIPYYYQEVVELMKKRFSDSNDTPLIIIINGKPNSGKSTLSRFLSYYFNISNLEMDIFLTRTGYNMDLVSSQIKIMTDSKKSLIVEGCKTPILTDKNTFKVFTERRKIKKSQCTVDSWYTDNTTTVRPPAEYIVLMDCLLDQKAAADALVIVPESDGPLQN